MKKLTRDDLMKIVGGNYPVEGEATCNSDADCAGKTVDCGTYGQQTLDGRCYDSGNGNGCTCKFSCNVY